MLSTGLLVIGAGPYALAAAARARDAGIDPLVVGRPMGFWREHMPAGMLLRSGLDWHLDAAEVHTFEAWVQERGLDPADIDPVPVGAFLEYADWFAEIKRLAIRPEHVTALAAGEDGFTAELESGERVRARAVVAAPGVRYFAALPAWAPRLPAERFSHTCDLVDLDRLAGMRVVIVGGRQSAYEWAALLVDAGAARIDVVHRHPTPAFAPVSWAFVDELTRSTVAERGWWRRRTPAEQQAVTDRFWELGRLTLEPWLFPRLADPRVHRHELTQIVDVAGDGPLRLTTSRGATLEADHVVFATGYQPDLARVPYLAGVLGELEVRDGFPVLDDTMGTSVPGLHIPGAPATRDFGPMFGFVKAAPAAATLVVEGVLARA